jgi:protein subunit release factor A
MKEIHLTKKDFKIDWFSGQGAGGQHRNKTQNCCRITHIESGLMVTGQNSRSRVTNQKEAFEKLSRLVIAWYNANDEVKKQISNEVIRNYHAVRNEVHDKESGLKQSYKHVVTDGNIGDMLAARRIAKGEDDGADG